MTTPTITCEQFADDLSAFLEREVDESTRARMELHALGCIPCGELLADLRRLRIDATNLPDLTPSRDLWSDIATRIETPVVVLAPGGRVADGTQRTDRGGNRLGFRAVWMGAAAAALVATTAIVTRRMSVQPAVTTPTTVATTQPVESTPSAVVPSSAPSAVPQTTVAATVDSTKPSARTTPAPKATASFVANRPSAEQTYDTEIKRLRVILAARKSTLDTTTVNVIERNLKVIDDAIAQCKAALQKDPASRFLMESLNDALDTKVQLLRTAAMLPART